MVETREDILRQIEVHQREVAALEARLGESRGPGWPPVGFYLAWAFAYNAGAVALAAAGKLTAVVAALAMLASSAFVVANARRLAHVAPTR